MMDSKSTISSTSSTSLAAALLAAALLLPGGAAQAQATCPALSGPTATPPYAATCPDGAYGTGIIYEAATGWNDGVASDVAVTVTGGTNTMITAPSVSQGWRSAGIVVRTSPAASRDIDLTVGTGSNDVVITEHATGSNHGVYIHQAGTGADDTTVTLGSGVKIGAETAPMRLAGVQILVLSAANTGVHTLESAAMIHSTSYGIELLNRGAGDVAVTNSGSITTAATGGQDGIRVRVDTPVDTKAAPTTVTNSGTITVATAGKHGIYVDGTGAGLHKIVNSGTITLSGTGMVGHGIHVSAGRYKGTAGTEDDRRGIEIENSGAIMATRTGFSTGIYVEAVGADGTDPITITNTGDITSDSVAILVNSDMGAVTVTASDGDITSRSDDGIAIQQNADADMTVTSGADITAGRRGIRVQAVAGTDDTSTPNMDESSTTGNISITTTGGSIKAESDGMDGIWSQDHAAHTGSVTIVNAASITADRFGILADRAGAGAVSVTNRGAITAGQSGIRAASARNGNVEVMNEEGGRITSTASHGIHVSPNTLGSATVTNKAEIVAGGTEAPRSTGAHGIFVLFPWQMEDTASSPAAGRIVNEGPITAGADGILLAHHGLGPAEVENSGSVTAPVTGIYVTAAARNTGGVTVTNEGAITVTNRGEIAIDPESAFAPGHGVWDGEAETYGIRVWNGGTGPTRIVNRGAITVDGPFSRTSGAGDTWSTGIRAIEPGTGDLTIENSADIIANNYGIFAHKTGEAETGSAGDVAVTHSAGEIFAKGSVAAIRAQVGRWRNEEPYTNGEPHPPTSTGSVTVDVTGGKVKSSETFPTRAIWASNFENGSVTVNVASGAELITSGSTAIHAELIDQANTLGRIKVTQAGKTTAHGGVYANVARGSEAAEERAASAQPLIDVVWTGTFELPSPEAPLHPRVYLPNNVPHAVEVRMERDARRFFRGALAPAGIEAEVVHWRQVIRTVAAGDDPGAFEDAAAQAALFADDADAATRARAASIVAQFKSTLDNEGNVPLGLPEGGTSEGARVADILGARAIDGNGDGTFDEAEIRAYLAEDDPGRRSLLRDVLRRGLSEAERAVLVAVETGDSAAVADALTAAGFSDDTDDDNDYWSRVTDLLDLHNVGDIRIAVDGGSIAAGPSGSDGIRAYYALPHEDNGRIDVTVAQGASVAGDMAGIYAANAGVGGIHVSVAEGAEVTGGEAGIHVAGAGLGLGDLPTDWRTTLRLDDDADVDGLRQHYVTVHGTVTGGTDAAVHLVDGGMLYVGRTGKVLAGASGNAVLVNDPGVAHVFIEGEAKGAVGGDAAVHLTGGGSVRVGETGRVLANGADRAIRTDVPPGDTPIAKVILEVGTTEGVEGKVSSADVQSLLDRVEGSIGTGPTDGGSPRRDVVVALADGSGETIENAIGSDGTIALDPTSSLFPCPPGEVRGAGGMCAPPPPPCPAGQVRGPDGECRRAGDVRVSITTEGESLSRGGGAIDRPGGGILARYQTPNDANGAIFVTVAEGAEVTGAGAGIHVENAGAGNLDPVWANVLNLDKLYKLYKLGNPDVTGLRQHYVTVRGTVTGGTDAAVHLAGGGMLYVGPTGKVHAGGSSGVGVLVNDPGVAHVLIEGEVEGAEGGAAAVHLTGGGSVRVGETGRVLANGADRAIRTDVPPGDTPIAKVILEVGTTEGVEGKVSSADVQSLLDRVQGSIGTGPTDGGSPRRDVVVALADGSGGTIENAIGLDGTLNLSPNDFPSQKSPMRGFNCGMAEDPRCRLYSALPSMLLSMNGLPTYEERMSAARDAGGGWARVEAARGKWKADGATQQRADDSRAQEQENLAYDHRRQGLRAGLDFALGGAGRLGVSLHGLRGSAEMAQGGEADLSGYGLGLHATTAFAEGFHVDAQAATTWYDADLESARADRGTLKKGVNGRGHALGVEVGRRMGLGDGVSVTPRAGLTWSKADLGDFADGAARVSVEDARSLKGRMGVGVEKVLGGDGMDGAHLFGSLDVEQEFEEETEARVSGMSPGSSVTSLKAKAEKTAYRLAVGGASVWGEGSYSLRGSVGYTASGGDNRDLGGGLSFSMRF